MSGIPPWAWRTGQFAFTAILIVLLWSALDGPEVLHILSRANPVWLIAAVAILLGQTALSAIRWQATAAQLGQILPLGYAVKEYFIAQVVNQTLPGAVTGDAARAVRARGGSGMAVSGQAVFFERLAGQFAMFGVFAIAFLLTWLIRGGIEWPPTTARFIGAAILVGCFAIAVLCFLPARVSWLGALRKSLFAPKVLPTQIALGCTITAFNLLAFGFCAHAVGVDLSFVALCAIVPAILFAMLIPVTVSGWGLREGAAAVLLPLAGVSTSAAVAVSVLFGCAMLASTVPGLAALVMR